MDLWSVLPPACIHHKAAWSYGALKLSLSLSLWMSTDSIVMQLLGRYLVFALLTSGLSSASTTPQYRNALFKREDEELSYTGCQEAIGAPPIFCEAESCGGENEEGGRCSKLDCECNIVLVLCCSPSANLMLRHHRRIRAAADNNNYNDRRQDNNSRVRHSINHFI